MHAHGDKRPYVVAIITPSPIETLEWGVNNNIVDQKMYPISFLSRSHLNDVRLIFAKKLYVTTGIAGQSVSSLR